MGGYGSGRRSGWAWKTTVEETPHIDIRNLNLNNLRVGERYGPVIHLEGIELFLTTTSPHFGGLRYWFCCPACHCRVKTLYKTSSAGRYACRNCHDLAYKTQRLSPHDRCLHKAMIARERLGASGSLLDSLPGEKPPGIHFFTYLRLKIDALRLTEKAWRELAKSCGIYDKLFGQEDWWGRQ